MVCLGSNSRATLLPTALAFLCCAGCIGHSLWRDYHARRGGQGRPLLVNTHGQAPVLAVLAEPAPPPYSVR